MKYGHTVLFYTVILIDTNILVYGIDEDSAFFKRARKILEQDKNQLVTTSKNLIEFLAITKQFRCMDTVNPLN